MRRKKKSSLPSPIPQASAQMHDEESGNDFDDGLLGSGASYDDQQGFEEETNIPYPLLFPKHVPALELVAAELVEMARVRTSLCCCCALDTRRLYIRRAACRQNKVAGHWCNHPDPWIARGTAVVKGAETKASHVGSSDWVQRDNNLHRAGRSAVCP